jgi:hypothetical protein
LEDILQTITYEDNILDETEMVKVFFIDVYIFVVPVLEGIFHNYCKEFDDIVSPCLIPRPILCW